MNKVEIGIWGLTLYMYTEHVLHKQVMYLCVCHYYHK